LPLIVVFVILGNFFEALVVGGSTGYCGCCICGDEADVCVSAHTQPPLLGSMSVIITRVNSFSPRCLPQEGNLSLE
jgi:hypothetical protein